MSVLEDTKHDVAQRVNAQVHLLQELSHRIHAHPEIAHQEYRAAEWCVQALRSAGLTVREGVYGLPTAFEAVAGNGPTTVVFCCEYDALPGIGHACGHNIVAAAGVGAGIGLAEVADAVGLTVKVLGTPAEEAGGGKVLLLERGAFIGAHAAMMVHPGPVEAAVFRSLARTSLTVRYRGRSAHAAVAPQEGRNAADAMTIAQVALGLLRQQLPATSRLHGVVHHAGDTPNVIPDRSAGRFVMRALTTADLAGVRSRVEECFRGAGMAAGCGVELEREEPDYEDFRTDRLLVTLYAANARLIGRAPPADLWPSASTDMGNVSHVVPAIHPTMDIDSGQVVPHQSEFAAHCITAAADRAVADGATTMAWTALDLTAQRAAPPDTGRMS